MITALKNFVKHTTDGRDPSHGYEHMEKVYENSVKIMDSMDRISELDRMMVTMVAYLHDVADHKYDKDGKLRKKVIGFLRNYQCEFLMECIDCISFSKEKKLGKKYYETILPEELIGIRNIVSDADKIEALGVTGLERCEMYTRHDMEEKGENITEDEVMKRVLLHCKEKLFILTSEYIRTKPGYEMAKKLDGEMREWIENKLVNI